MIMTDDEILKTAKKIEEKRKLEKSLQNFEGQDIIVRVGWKNLNNVIEFVTIPSTAQIRDSTKNVICEKLTNMG